MSNPNVTPIVAGTIKNKVRQGDVYIIKQKSEPKGTFETKPTAILAYGEVTGHKHEVVGLDTNVQIAIALIDGKNFLRITGGDAIVRHEEHHHITLPPGNYEYRIQREYDPVEEQRKVRD